VVEARHCARLGRRVRELVGVGEEALRVHFHRENGAARAVRDLQHFSKRAAPEHAQEDKVRRPRAAAAAAAARARRAAAGSAAAAQAGSAAATAAGRARRRSVGRVGRERHRRRRRKVGRVDRERHCRARAASPSFVRSVRLSRPVPHHEGPALSLGVYGISAFPLL